MSMEKLHELTREELINTFIEIEIGNGEGNTTTDDFLKIRETLSRIGVANASKSTMYQSCHILHKRNRYYIVHFKELFALDGRIVDMSEEDYARRNSIAKMLERWDMCKIVDKSKVSDPVVSNFRAITVIPYKDKKNWTLETKYSIGGSKVSSRTA